MTHKMINNDKHADLIQRIAQSVMDEFLFVEIDRSTIPAIKQHISKITGIPVMYIGVIITGKSNSIRIKIFVNEHDQVSFTIGLSGSTVEEV